MSCQVYSKSTLTALEYIEVFFEKLYYITGFTISALTRAGLAAKLKIVAIQFYQLDIKGQILSNLFEIIKMMSNAARYSYNNTKETAVAILTTFCNIAEKTVDFLFIRFGGQLVLSITASTCFGVTCSINILYYLLIAAFGTGSRFVFNKFKEYLKQVVEYVEEKMMGLTGLLSNYIQYIES